MDKKLFKQYVFYIFIYPAWAIIYLPFLLIFSGFKCISLLAKGVRKYSMFSPYVALNSYFYMTRALNISRFSRSGKSPYIGLGNYDLSRTFHYTLGSLFPFWKSSNLTLIAGFSLLFGTLFYFSQDYLILGPTIFIFSAIAYMNYTHQNYNVLGWAFFPFLIISLLSQNFLWLAIALSLISFFSFTVWFISSLIIGITIIYSLSFSQIWVLIPGLLIILTNFIPFLKTGKMSATLQKVAKAIGITRQNTRYVRANSKNITYLGLKAYILGPFILFPFFIEGIDILTWVIYGSAIFIYCINYLVMRFADDQSMYLMMAISAVCLFITYDFQILPTIILVIALNPLPFSMNLRSTHPLLLPIIKPFNIKKIEATIGHFFAKVSKGERVFMAYPDPGNQYEAVFDGKRVFIEAPHYIANQKEFHLMPDWWGVFELNYMGAKEIWGNEPQSLADNMHAWNAQWGIVYQNDNKQLDQKWIDFGFKLQAELDWTDFTSIMQDQRIIRANPPKWFLLKMD